ncbi:5-(carboxyamino)imidazole ribonucleotide synthase [Loigolactobacillus backii]|uniref:N5-carboxyaminoimidazole ribonucleotide synthase n=1 Tax=Loigolactobacillus backii TaxID=375175 RepID=A0A192GYZ9_9LACO|nr:5-(carboxyamino)imidazole ribonucleotide synthase [Loigolactobacillus backii]ANK61754.1 5-(carboxyamino)imidazole ribonucleotide synthase [Loigolactobacillus backii]ANK69052.1 5-(carboxyamino)imidazole ribonucleotide synthase [Loigolactobacillus backii]MDA5387215.1 5-(carboxyamino)imidazole ribonucleotide synthase [Loigolactobacillus backii]MDA5389711.1 5-(carboxyamino)imidazole ribonucleotide synthase [Loigolactobacillus backii]PIO82273.1 5-(carboxyamino)imidazole ribonucleotide synthase [
MSNNSTKVILPPATIGIVGGGQLGQMMALSAKTMGYKVGVLDPTPHAPAGQVADFQITAAYTDTTALMELAQRSAVLTYEFENVDEQALIRAQTVTELPQGTELLHITGDRLNEKNFLRSAGLPVTNFAAVTDSASLTAAINQIGYPAILKTAAGGYDGHGQLDLNGAANLPAAAKLYQQAGCILEARQKFIGEAAMMVTRTAAGKIITFPLVEDFHKHHILHTTIAPARFGGTIEELAKAAAVKIAAELNLRGVLGIEFFILDEQHLLINELAPRPHNSGHYSIEACNISQFEAHIRSICGLPIPAIKQEKTAVMTNLLGSDLTKARQLLVDHPEWHFHDYGKDAVRPQRKLGHITVLGDNVEQLLASTQALKGDD